MDGKVAEGIRQRSGEDTVPGLSVSPARPRELYTPRHPDEFDFGPMGKVGYRTEGTQAFKFEGRGEGRYQDRQDYVSDTDFLAYLLQHLNRSKETGAPISPRATALIAFDGAMQQSFHDELISLVDDIHAHPEHHGYLRILTDGAGGHAGGEFSAVMATNQMLLDYHREIYRSTRENLNVTSEEMKLIQTNALEKAMKRTNQKLYERNILDKVDGKAATVLDLELNDHSHEIRWAGDCAALIYEYSDETRRFEFKEETIPHLANMDLRTHSRMPRLVETGSNVISSALGKREMTEIGRLHVGSSKGSLKIVLASDGVELSYDEMETIMNDPTLRPEQEAEQLYDSSLRAGSTDNISVIVVTHNPIFEVPTLADLKKRMEKSGGLSADMAISSPKETLSVGQEVEIFPADEPYVLLVKSETGMLDVVLVKPVEIDGVPRQMAIKLNGLFRNPPDENMLVMVVGETTDQESHKRWQDGFEHGVWDYKVRRQGIGDIHTPLVVTNSGKTPLNVGTYRLETSLASAETQIGSIANSLDSKSAITGGPVTPKDIQGAAHLANGLSNSEGFRRMLEKTALEDDYDGFVCIIPKQEQSK